MREIFQLNTKWAFQKGITKPPEIIPKDWYLVNLPHTWNAIDGQDGGSDYYRGSCCYAKEIEKNSLPENDRYYLEIQGANSSADVYVDGRKLAHHDGGYSTWRVDITEALTGKNILAILVDNCANDRVYPQNADFTFYGGLYRNVNIIVVKETHFDLEYYGTPGIRVTPQINGADAAVEVETYVTGAKEGQKLRFQIFDAKGQLVAEKTQPVSEVQCLLEIPEVHLWNGKKDPYLYRAEVCICRGDEVLDSVSARFGCRSFAIDPQKGFLLNGERYPLRGVSRHQDRWGVGNALLPEHHREDMELICELGATTIRLAHYQHDQYFYDLCDEKGMIVWAEIPYISSHMPSGRENTISQMKELIIQNYNHPSIVVWGISNEITMGCGSGSDTDLQENHRILNDLAHQMDKTRLTTIAAMTTCDIHDDYIQIPDVVSYNHYFGWYGGDTSMNGPWFDKFHEEFPDIPIGVSEYGCEALNWHTSDPKQGDYTEEYQAYYHEELIKQLYTRDYLWATHVWNMFDFGADARNEGGENGQNHKGLVTFDRKYKKDAFYAYKAWLSDEPFVHICGKRYIDRVEDVTKITVYSNLPEVELFVNGKSLGRQKSAEHFFYFGVINEGESVIKAAAGNCEDESRIRKVEKFNDDYRLKEKGAVLNWFDITEEEGYYSLNDTIGDIMKSEGGRAVFMGLIESISAGGEGVAAAFKPENMDSLMQMMNSFTMIRMINTFGAMGPEMKKEQLLKINRKLNQIPKV